MARYIDVDKLIAEYDRVHIGAPGGARKLMVDAPTADVQEVVKCQECKHCTKYELRGDVLSRRYICNLDIDVCDEDFFCKYGERKDI